MFIGHAALGFAAKRVAPRTSLAWLLVAPWLLDLVWPILLLLGIERVRIAPGTTAFTPLDFVWYPWSHSLAMAIVWGGLAAAAYRSTRRDRGGSWVVGGLVVSHWVLDAIVHRPDLPWAPGISGVVGFGLWNSIPATVAVEGLLFACGLAVYGVTTRARDRRGRWGLWGLVVFLITVYAANLGGPPPPTPAAIAWVTLAFGAIIAPWAMWIERHRESRSEAGGRSPREFGA